MMYVSLSVNVYVALVYKHYIDIHFVNLCILGVCMVCVVCVHRKLNIVSICDRRNM